LVFSLAAWLTLIRLSIHQHLTHRLSCTQLLPLAGYMVTMTAGDIGFQVDGLQHKFVTYLSRLRPEIVTAIEMGMLTVEDINN